MPEWRFVKIHTHGAPESEAGVVLEPQVDALFSYLEDRYNDGERYVLHYVTDSEVHHIIQAAEAGHDDDPNDYRDFIRPPPRSSFAGPRSRRSDENRVGQ